MNNNLARTFKKNEKASPLAAEDSKFCLNSKNGFFREDLRFCTIMNSYDFLFCYIGYKAIRLPDAGSWFIQTLCNQLQKHVREEDLESIITSVVDEMKKMRADVKGAGRSKSTAEKHSNLSKKFFFYPQKTWDAYRSTVKSLQNPSAN